MCRIGVEGKVTDLLYKLLIEYSLTTYEPITDSLLDLSGKVNKLKRSTPNSISGSTYQVTLVLSPQILASLR